MNDAAATPAVAPAAAPAPQDQSAAGAAPAVTPTPAEGVPAEGAPATDQPPDKPQGAPESYTFTAPDGLALDSGVTDAFAGVAKELGAATTADEVKEINRSLAAMDGASPPAPSTAPVATASDGGGPSAWRGR